MDETIGGGKNSNHVLSCLIYFVEIYISVDIRFLKVYLDSAEYFRCNYLPWWAAEMISSNQLKRVVFSYMVSGHTVFAADTLFAALANIHFKTDVFNTIELVGLILKSCNCHRLTNHEMRRCKENLAPEYVNIAHVTQFNFFLVEMFPSTLEAHDINVTVKLKFSVTNANITNVFEGEYNCTFLRKKRVNYSLAV